MSKKAPSYVRLPEQMESTLTDYSELNPAYDLQSTDPRIVEELRESLLAELDDIFYVISRDEQGGIINLTPRNPRTIEKLLAVYQLELSGRIQGLLGNTLWEAKGPATDEEFRGSSRTIIKTLQEIVSHIAERMEINRDEPEIANGEALARLNISPKEITDTLLRNLGLTEHIPPKGTRAKERMALMIKAIPAVREKLGKLEPIERSSDTDPSDLKYFRLMRMTEGDTEGAVLGTQMIGEDKVLFKTTLDGSERRLLNIEAGYQEEIKLLKFIEITLGNVNKNLAQWMQLDLEDINKIKATLLECVGSLEHVQNEHKQALRRHIKGCLSLKDKRGRHNPTIIRDKLDRAIPYVGQRLTEIGEIWKYIGNDKGRVQEIKAAEKAPLLNFCQEVEDLHGKFKILKPAEGQLMEEREKSRVIRNLEERKEEAAQLLFEPYLSFGRKFIAQIDIVIGALHENNFEMAAREFLKLYLITKIDKAYEEIAEIHLRISAYPDLISPESLKAEINEKRNAFGRKTVASQIEIEEYQDSYDELYHLYNSLHARLRELINGKTQQEGIEPESAPVQGKSHKLHDMLDALHAALPTRLHSFVNKARSIVSSFVSGISGRPDLPIQKQPQIKAGESREGKGTYSKEQKEETYKVMKERIKGFDFAKLVRNLPDTPHRPSLHATRESAAS